MYLIKKIYHNLLPAKLRNRIRIIKNRNTDLGQLRKEIISYYNQLPATAANPEMKNILSFIKKNGVATFPYKFIFNYKEEDIKVYTDDSTGLPYVLVNNKKLFFKRSWDHPTVRKNFNFLSIEQDQSSPHLYLTESFNIKLNDTVVDIGAAEGNFSLGIVEKVKALYIFETDADWIEALQATFAPWKDKVTIVNLYVSDKVDAKNITVDAFFVAKPQINFIKIDAEGAERQILTGSEKILDQNADLKIALCTYHKQNDEIELAQILKQSNFNISYSAGYMLFLEDKLTAPFFRKVLIRAHK